MSHVRTVYILAKGTETIDRRCIGEIKDVKYLFLTNLVGEKESEIFLVRFDRQFSLAKYH